LFLPSGGVTPIGGGLSRLAEALKTILGCALYLLTSWLLEEKSLESEVEYSTQLQEREEAALTLTRGQGWHMGRREEARDSPAALLRLARSPDFA
jgi:hypothetical protein